MSLRHLVARSSILLATTLAGFAHAQSSSSPLLDAAAQLNNLAPQAVPAQTVALGTWDGATGTMSWTIPLVYPPNLPESKKSENGGYVHPHPEAPVNSYNLTYEIQLQHAPADLELVLTQNDEHGVPTEINGQVNLGAHVARVAFHPHSNGMQTLTFKTSGGDSVQHLFPHLQEQLGAFVVPYLLITIVYEPPGALSSASYTSSSTAGTTVSWSFARTSGLFDVEEPDELRNTMLEITSAGLGAAGPVGGVMSAAVTVLSRLETTTSVTTTQSTTHAEGGAHGTSFTVGASFDTGMHQYPGQGDRFVILKNVLYVYLVTDGKVHLAPMGFEGPPRAMTLAEMQAALPNELVQQFSALDPLLTGHLPVLGATSKFPGLQIPGKGPHGAPRFRHFALWACEGSGGDGIIISQSDLTSSSVSETTSETALTQTTGILASLDEGANSMWSLTYSSQHEQYQQDEIAATIRLQCGPNEQPFGVDVWLDTVFHTMLCVRGPALDTQSYMTGTVDDENGQPRIRERVVLRLGERTYMTQTDATGTFRFPFRDLPNGAGALVAGRQAWPITFTGAPIANLRLGLARGGEKVDLGALGHPSGASSPPASKGENGAKGLKIGFPLGKKK